MNAPQRRFASSILALVGTLGVLALSNPAHAEADAARTQSVRYGDLNLNVEAGRATFEQRLARAARRVCDDPSRIVSPTEIACRMQASAQARRAAGLSAPAASADTAAAAPVRG